MPFFHVDDLNTTEGRFGTACRLHVVLLYPDDHASQGQFMATCASVGLGSPAPPPPALPASEPFRVSVGRASAWEMFERHGGFGAVAKGVGVDACKQLMEAAEKNRNTASAVLAVIGRMAKHPRIGEHASVNRAVWLLERERPLRRMHSNPKDIKQAWTRYKPVAHFCATMLEVTLSTRREIADPAEGTVHIQRVLAERTDDLIGVAATYQEFGLNYRLPRTKGQPALDPADIYRLRTEHADGAGREIPPLPDRLAELVLREYRAPIRLS